MTHLYSLEDVLAYTPEELDAYLLTKDWAAESLGDKRQATLMLLQADSLLDEGTSNYVAAPTFAAAIQQISVVRDSRYPRDFLPIVCLTHSTSVEGFTGILKLGVIETMMQSMMTHTRRTDQYPGVYMTPYLDTASYFARHYGITFVFSSTLLGRGDWHFNPQDNFGYIAPFTLSQPTLGRLNPSKMTGHAEVVFHHAVRIDETDRLIGIWCNQDNVDTVNRSIIAAGREDLLALVIIESGHFFHSLIRDHEWPHPIEPRNANFCTRFIGSPCFLNSQSEHPLIAMTKTIVNCGHTPEDVTAILKRDCEGKHAGDCMNALIRVAFVDSEAILAGRRPESPTVYWPPLQDVPLTGVKFPASVGVENFTPLWPVDPVPTFTGAVLGTAITRKRTTRKKK